MDTGQEKWESISLELSGVYNVRDPLKGEPRSRVPLALSEATSSISISKIQGERSSSLLTLKKSQSGLGLGGIFKTIFTIHGKRPILYIDQY